MSRIGIIVCILMLFLAGCSNNNKTSDKGITEAKQTITQISEKEREEAKRTILNYIKALNDKDFKEFLRNLSSYKAKEVQQNTNAHIPEYEYARIVNITPDNSETSKDAYLKHGRGTYTKPIKLTIFKVEWVGKQSPNGIDEDNEKKVLWKFFLIKEKENDIWKIDDFGY